MRGSADAAKTITLQQSGGRWPWDCGLEHRGLLIQDGL
jgi:hypothetical protein